MGKSRRARPGPVEPVDAVNDDERRLRDAVDVPSPRRAQNPSDGYDPPDEGKSEPPDDEYEPL